MKVPRVVAISTIALVALAAIATSAAFGLSNGEKIYPGVKIAGEDVGGLTASEAQQRFSEKARALENAPIAVKCGQFKTVTNAAQLGVGIDVEDSVTKAFSVGREGNFLQRIAVILETRQGGRDIPVAHEFDKSKAEAYVETLAKSVDRKPVDATLNIRRGGFRVSKESPGLKLDQQKSLAKIEREIGGLPSKLDLPVVVDNPRVTAKDFSAIDGVLGSYSTRFKPRQVDRTHNLLIAVKAIDGTLVKPGETFSYNKEVGPREKRFGFRDAPIFVRGEVEPGTGGGICQVSTTLYNAVLLADLQIAQRSHHSRPVTYAPVGRDATVAYPSLDFRFRNNTGAPVYVSASLGRSTVNISILGKRTPGRKVSIVSADHSTTPAPVVHKVSTPDHPVKPDRGSAGHKITTYRVVTEGGKSSRERLYTDVYRPQPRIVVEKPKPEPEPKPVAQGAATSHRM